MQADHELIDREIVRLSRLGLDKGADVASEEAVNRLIAIVRWLDMCYGTKLTYDVVQGAADNLIAHGRDRRRLNIDLKF